MKKEQLEKAKQISDKIDYLSKHLEYANDRLVISPKSINEETTVTLNLVARYIPETTFNGYANSLQEAITKLEQELEAL